MLLLRPPTTPSTAGSVLLGQDDTGDLLGMPASCSDSEDAVDCIQSHQKSRHRYWMKSDVKEELFKTMKGLAELEVNHHA